MQLYRVLRMLFPQFPVSARALHPMPQETEPMTKLLQAMLAVLTCVASVTMFTGCIVAGYSSRGGGFIWPGGGLGLVVIILVVLYLLRRR